MAEPGASWAGCDDRRPLAERRHRPLRMGETAIVKAKMLKMTGVRINWDYQIQSPDSKELYLTAQVTLVAVDRQKGKIMRLLPLELKDALEKLMPQVD